MYAFIDGDAKEETEEYDYCTETTWGVFKAHAFLSTSVLMHGGLICIAFSLSDCPSGVSGPKFK